MLPISKTAARIHVAGKNADDIGNQCGGWTIDWQGRSGNVTTGGTTVLAAIKKAVSASTQVTFSADGTGAAGATVGVVVIGETPYAEGNGDRADLSLAPEDVAAIDNMKAAGIPVVVILFSGRPMILGDCSIKPTHSSPRGCPARKATASPMCCSAATSPPVSCRSRGRAPWINIPTRKIPIPLFAYGYGLTY